MPQDSLHTAVLSLGSNIEPAANLKSAVHLLQNSGQIDAVASTWETGAFGSSGPNFLNTVVIFRSGHTYGALTQQVLRPIDNRLGRVRVADKNAPRTIDLDILIFDGEVLDPELWERLYIALPAAELLPDLLNPLTGRTLLQTAGELQSAGCAVRRPDLHMPDA